MKCAQCSSFVLLPLVLGGTSARKIAQKARETTKNFELTSREKANIHTCADTLEWVAAELHRLREDINLRREGH